MCSFYILTGFEILLGIFYELMHNKVLYFLVIRGGANSTLNLIKLAQIPSCPAHYAY